MTLNRISKACEACVARHGDNEAKLIVYPYDAPTHYMAPDGTVDYLRKMDSTDMAEVPKGTRVFIYVDDMARAGRGCAVLVAPYKNLVITGSSSSLVVEAFLKGEGAA